MFEIIGSKESSNGQYTIIIEKNCNDKRKTYYTLYNNEAGTKKVFVR